MTQALLIIDVQRALFNAPPHPFEAEQVVQRINQVAQRARSAGAPVVIIQHERAKGPMSVNTEGWQLQPGLEVELDDLRVRKTTPDSFLRTNLKELLDQKGVTELTICGDARGLCVDTTTRRAAALGDLGTWGADGHTTHDKAHASAAQIRAHENATLPNIGSFGPVICAVPAADIRF
jgi:nicotinamidase-related amidase